MTIPPIRPGEVPPPLSSGQTPQSQQISELQFGIAVIGDYLSATGQFGWAGVQISHIQNEVDAGVHPDKIAPNLNALISQVNASMAPGKPPFPPFAFTVHGNQSQVIGHYALSLQKLLNTFVEVGKIPPRPLLSGQLRQLQADVSRIPTESALNTLNQIIGEINLLLPSQYQAIPRIASQRSR